MMKETGVLVVGGGPAGLLASIRAAQKGARVILVEKNRQLGRKLRITGKGRCNITNTGEINDFVRQYGGQGSFLYSVFSRFFHQDILWLLAEAGVETKEERGGRIFPESDQASDVAEALERLALEAGVEILKGCRVRNLLLEPAADGQSPKRVAGESLKRVAGESLKRVAGVALDDAWDRSEIRAKVVILATGGMSYPATGSTGDGYDWAENAGHKVVTPRPALVPLESSSAWVYELAGLTLKNVQASLWVYDADDEGGDAAVNDEAAKASGAALADGVALSDGTTFSDGVKFSSGAMQPDGMTLSGGVALPSGTMLSSEAVTREVALSDGTALSDGATLSSGVVKAVRLAAFQGEMLFTHFGISGPIVLSLSRYFPAEERTNVRILIDMKPALSAEVLDKRLQRDFQKYQKKQLANAMVELLPKAMIPAVIRCAELDGALPVAELTRGQRLKLGETLKALPIEITGTRPMDEAIVTAGGVDLPEVDPKTMASKKVAGLYFAGELLDIDGLTGGYNLQAAFSTGWAAGEGAANAAGVVKSAAEDVVGQAPLDRA
ncbi:MAG: NAD(P)/FAD-dependent oxidoreductase [Peptococcaceae bacterium]|jgi:predicted flavoprotein YhiN|nr:NAD(P)/FAD-dependent oxidoreductase [Peptococcaceae bacterium]